MNQPLDAGLTHEEHQEFHKRTLHDWSGPFIASMTAYANSCFSWFRHQGFWPVSPMPNADALVTIPHSEYIRLKKAEKIALMHSELSEMLEGIRNGIAVDAKGGEREEGADLLVRLLDYDGGFGIGVAQGFVDKQLKNFERPHRHGKSF